MKRTVFVLGAGASRAYGFPTGNELSQRIIDFAQSPYSNIKGAAKLREALKSLNEFDELSAFGDAFKKSAQASVDAFLERRTEYMALGKMVMGGLLAACENEDHLFAPRTEVGVQADHWMQWLFLRFNKRPQEIPDLPVSFVTFNYDRSLEHFLHTAMCNNGLSIEDAADALARIPIVHVYGQLGTYSRLSRIGGAEYSTAPSTSGLDYGAEVSAARLEQYRDGIALFKERMSDQSHNCFAVAKELLQRAEVVVFLGFGFDAINLQRLGFPLVAYHIDRGDYGLALSGANQSVSSNIVVRGTAYGLKSQEIAEIGNYRVVDNQLERSLPDLIQLEDTNCTGLLRSCFMDMGLEISTYSR